MRDKNCPFFSVGIPVYNSEQYLSACIESILKQEFTDFEIICIDDCSNDDSARIIEDFIKKDKRIRIIKHINNKGILLTRKEIAESSRGKYFLWCDSDDELVPGALSSFYKIISSYNEPDIGIIHSASLVMINGDEKSNIIYSPVSIKKLTTEDAIGFVLANNGLRSFPWIFVVPTKIVNEAFAVIPASNTRDYVDDVLVSHKYLFGIKKVVYLQKDFYKYFVRKNSDSTDPLIIKRLCNTICFTIDHLGDRNNHLKITLKLLFNLYSAIYYSVGDEEKKNYDNIKRIHRELLKTKKDKYAKKYISKKNALQIWCLKFLPTIFYRYYSKKTTRYSGKRKSE